MPGRCTPSVSADAAEGGGALRFDFYPRLTLYDLGLVFHIPQQLPSE